MDYNPVLALHTAAFECTRSKDLKFSFGVLTELFRHGRIRGEIGDRLFGAAVPCALALINDPRRSSLYPQALDFVDCALHTEDVTPNETLVERLTELTSDKNPKTAKLAIECLNKISIFDLNLITDDVVVAINRALRLTTNAGIKESGEQFLFDLVYEEQYEPRTSEAQHILAQNMLASCGLDLKL